MSQQTDHPAQVRAIADYLDGPNIGPRSKRMAEHLRAAATRIEQLEQAIEYVASTFERSGRTTRL